VSIHPRAKAPVFNQPNVGEAEIGRRIPVRAKHFPASYDKPNAKEFHPR
jgi:predicted RNA-binding Zn-ribbon protein involved in translation (DUF1610 family)